eukprot:476834-Rhodomonas_salina.1
MTHAMPPFPTSCALLGKDKPVHQGSLIPLPLTPSCDQLPNAQLTSNLHTSFECLAVSADA